MERHRHRPAHDAAGGAVRVLALTRITRWGSPAAVALLAATLAAQELPPALAEQFSQGVAALSAGDLDKAEAAFRSVIRSGPPRAFVHHNLGIVLQRRDRHADAVAEFRAASRVDPEFGPARLLAGTSLLALGQGAAAKTELERAVRLMPGEPAARLMLADACERTGDVIGLVDQYRALAASAPQNAEYAYRLGRAYLRLSQWAHERIRTVDPTSARLNQALGREYLEQNRVDLAERALVEGAARDPKLADVHLALAEIYLADGRLDDASKAVTAALAAAPASRAAAALKARIDAARTPK